MSEAELREQLGLRSFGKVRKLFKRTRERFFGPTAIGTAGTPASSAAGGGVSAAASGIPRGPRLPALSPGLPHMGSLVSTPRLSPSESEAGFTTRVEMS